MLLAHFIIINTTACASKTSVFGVILVRIFPFSD